jgi:RNA polymerase sigma-70 factor, ECF subfamily
MEKTTQKKVDQYTELTALFRSEDPAAYHRFLQLVAPILRGVVCRRLPTHDVEDVLQEILISIHKARHTYDGGRPIMPWLLAIAGFRINDALRKAYASLRKECVDINEFAEILIDVTETLRADEYINEMLDGLLEREQKILTLMHVEGCTAKETGERLGMKESAVKVAAHRAIKKIREKIDI